MGKKGSSKYENYFVLGTKFNSWTITGPVIMNGEAKVHVTCECGYSAAVSCYAVKIGSSKGCIKCDQKKRTGENNHTWRGYGEVPGSFTQRFNRKCKEKGWLWEVTAEDINTIFLRQNRKCALTGLEVSFQNLNEEKFGYSCTASLDRIDSKKGYTLDNIQVVHKDINMMKNQYPQDYFIQMCKLVAGGACEVK
jgi:hypothetical protein